MQSNGQSPDWENKSDKQASWPIEDKKAESQVSKDWEGGQNSLKIHNTLSPTKHPWIVSPESVPDGNKGSWESQQVSGSVLRTPQWPQ